MHIIIGIQASRLWLLLSLGLALIRPLGAQMLMEDPMPALEVAVPELGTSDHRPYPRFTFEGQLQLQVDGGSLGSPRIDVPFPSSNGMGLAPAASHLFIRRFRPSLDIELGRDLTLQTEASIDLNNHRIQLLDARLDHALSAETLLSVGRYKVPFGWEGLRSSRSTNTIERSDMTAALYPERDVGLSISHSEGDLADLSVGVFLGQPRSQGGPNGHLDLIGRARLHLGDLHLGVSGQEGSFRPEGRQDDLPVRRLGTELQYESGPVKVELEAVWSDGYNTMSRADTRAFGYYLAGVYRLTDSLDLVLHYDRFDPALGVSHQVRGRNEVNARDRKVLGLNYEVEGRVTHRLMLNYEWKSELEGGHARDHGWRARYQISW